MFSGLTEYLLFHWIFFFSLMLQQWYYPPLTDPLLPVQTLSSAALLLLCITKWIWEKVNTARTANRESLHRTVNHLLSCGDTLMHKFHSRFKEPDVKNIKLHITFYMIEIWLMMKYMSSLILWLIQCNWIISSCYHMCVCLCVCSVNCISLCSSFQLQQSVQFLFSLTEGGFCTTLFHCVNTHWLLG